MNLSDEEIKEAAEKAALDIAILASSLDKTPQELFDHLGESLKRIEATQRARLDPVDPT